MNELTVLLGIAAIALLVGGGLGYWLADRRARLQAAKTEDVQQRFDDYRKQVTRHFGRTAEHFQAIGEQYRELYEHMASGAETLFDAPEPAGRLDTAARAALAEAAAPAGAEADKTAAIDDAGATGEASAASDSAATESRGAKLATKLAKAEDGADTAGAAESADGAGRTYH